MLKWLAARFELSRGEAQGNVRPMEGLRGFAVLLVFCTHYVTLIGPWLNEASWLGHAADALHTVGNAGVDLFFVLSGYLIYGSLMARPQAYLAFMRRRVRRIHPTFLAVLAIYLLLSLVFPAERKIPADTADAAVYLLQNILLLPGLFPIVPIITVAWSGMVAIADASVGMVLSMGGSFGRWDRRRGGLRPVGLCAMLTLLP